MIELADIRDDGDHAYALESRCVTCGTVLGRTFGMIGRQLHPIFGNVHAAALLTASRCLNGCPQSDGAVAADVLIVRD